MHEVQSQSQNEPPVLRPALPDSPNHSLAKATRRTKIGALITAAYLCAFTIYIFVRFDAFVAMKPDEFATFLSGVFAPLAFLWLVLGFFQQGEELSQSSRALWLQGEELRNSVEQQRELVGVSRDQLDFERATFERQDEQARKSALPDIVFLQADIQMMSNTSSWVIVRLLNRGPQCKDLRVHVTDEECIRQTLLDTNEEFAFRVQIDDDEPEDQPRCFLVEFTDVLGHRGKQTICLARLRTSQGHFTLSTET